MKLRLLQFSDVLTTSFWFVPAIMALVAAAVAYGSVALDRELGDGSWANNGWIWSGSATGARSVLSTVAGSIMTVVSIVFSITITILAQVSSKFGPRVLRNFTSDRGNQITLGTFIATCIYCLLVLRTVRDVEERVLVPDLSGSIGVALGLHCGRSHHFIPKYTEVQANINCEIGGNSNCCRFTRKIGMERRCAIENFRPF